MSFEEVIYEAPVEDATQTRDQDQKQDNSSFFISLRSNERDSNSVTDQQISFVNDPSSDENDIILCALWQAGYLGAAYYSRQESELYILNDIIDLKPDYMLTKNLYNQIKPSFTITLGTMASKFVCALSCIAKSPDLEDEELSSVVETVTSLPPNIELLKKDKYSLNLCIHSVQSIKLSCEPADLTDEERRIYIQSLVNFNKTVSLQALGALVMFLKSSGEFTNNTGELSFLNINTITVNNLVLMNSDAFQTLQIFNSGRGYEGQSIIKLFNRCRSTIGCKHLKHLLLSPTNHLETLRKRHEFIEFCLKPINSEIASTIHECLSNIFPITTALNKIHKSQYTINNWKTLYSTLHNVSCVNRICRPYIKEVTIFKDFVNEAKDVIETTMELITDTIDFESKENRKVEVKIGVNKTLDQKKRYRSEIKERITLAANYEIQNLPAYINECSIVYIPRIGHVVAVKKWSSTAQYTDVEHCGYKHQFTIGDVFNFKSAVCDELDKCLGDIQSEIEDLENSIIFQLSQAIIQNSKDLKRRIQGVAQFDSLICLAQVAKQLGYICPVLVEENILNIEDGRHPLSDTLNITNFVPNSYTSGPQTLKIITGPNNSGKSVYLKQTALIVYLAHIGSYIPAKSATIGMMYSIHTNIYGRSKDYLNLSSFAVPLLQMSQSINTSKMNSLILIDEFGRPTIELDGLALLTSFLEHYLLREESCPHILVSTHYLHLTNLIPESKFVEHLKCDMKMIDDRVVFLYKIVKGISKSFAKYTATKAGIMKELIKRSDEIMKSYLEELPIKPVELEYN